MSDSVSLARTHPTTHRRCDCLLGNALSQPLSAGSSSVAARRPGSTTSIIAGGAAAQAVSHSSEGRRHNSVMPCPDTSRRWCWRSDYWHLRLPPVDAMHDAQLLLALHGASHESVCPGQGSGTHSVPLASVYLQTWLELQVIALFQMQWRPH